MTWNKKPCEDRMCVVNNGKGWCTNEGVILGKSSCLGWREPGGEWLLKYNFGEYLKYLKGERDTKPFDLTVPPPPPPEPKETEDNQQRLEVF